jgi:hypothetical protein
VKLERKILPVIRNCQPGVKTMSKLVSLSGRSSGPCRWATPAKRENISPACHQLLLPTGTFINTSSICGQAIGLVYKQFVALEKEYQHAVVQAGPATNSAYVGNSLAEGVDSTGDQLLGPNYRRPTRYNPILAFNTSLGRVHS